MIEIPVPGLEHSEIVIEADSESLVVRTQPRQRQPESDGGKFIQREHMPEPMSRVFEFPVEIDTDNIRATLDKGMLKIRVPKASVGRRRIIRIARPGDELTIRS